MATRNELRRHKASSPGRSRRERLLARWRLSTVLAAVVALAAVGAVLATALSLGGFGVPTDAYPQAINPNAVPFGLLSRSSPPTPPTTASGHKPPKLENPVLLWFVGPNGHLVPVAAQTTPPVLLESVLTRLLAGSPTGEVAGSDDHEILEGRISRGAPRLGSGHGSCHQARPRPQGERWGTAPA
jgi:hypothetical protein